MAKKQVIVKRLAAIENFGSMNVFCTDKTGTLTEGEVKIHSAVDVDGKESDRVLLYAYGSPGFMVYTVSSTTVCDAMIPSE